MQQSTQCEQRARVSDDELREESQSKIRDMLAAMKPDDLTLKQSYYVEGILLLFLHGRAESGE
jgi:hypothetical protein